MIGSYILGVPSGIQNSYAACSAVAPSATDAAAAVYVATNPRMTRILRPFPSTTRYRYAPRASLKIAKRHELDDLGGREERVWGGTGTRRYPTTGTSSYRGIASKGLFTGPTYHVTRWRFVCVSRLVHRGQGWSVHAPTHRGAHTHSDTGNTRQVRLGFTK